MRRRLIVAVAVVVAACASIQRPPGGPPRHEPPEVIAINPDSGETNVRRRNVQITFDEVIRDVSVGKDNQFNTKVLISPEVGSLNVSWHRNSIVAQGHEPFRPNTSYRVTLLPGIADLHGNTTKTTVSSLFSTGQSFDTLGIVGQVWDWESQKLLRDVTVLATKHLTAKDSITYVAKTDTSGSFALGPMPAGNYSVLAFFDQNKKGVLERTDKWDRLDTAITEFQPALKMMIIERDSAPPIISHVAQIGKDTLSLQVDFDEFLSPLIPLQPALVRVQRADSTELTVDSVRTLAQDNSVRAAAARAAPPRRDTTGGAATSAVPIPPAPVAVPTTASGAPRPQPKPPQPPPGKSIVIYLSPTTPLLTATTYRVTVREGFRNLLGASKSTSYTISIPKPPPSKPPSSPPR